MEERMKAWRREKVFWTTEVIAYMLSGICGF